MEKIQIHYLPVEDRLLFILKMKQQAAEQPLSSERMAELTQQPQTQGTEPLSEQEQKHGLTLWLTRRVTKKLLQSLQGLVGKDAAVLSQDNEVRKAHVQEFQREQAAQRSQFSQEKVDVKQVLEVQNPKLVADVVLDGKLLRMPMPNGQVLNLELSTQLAYVVTNLINSAVAHTDWQLASGEARSSIEFTHQKYPTMTLN